MTFSPADIEHVARSREKNHAYPDDIVVSTTSDRLGTPQNDAPRSGEIPAFKKLSHKKRSAIIAIVAILAIAFLPALIERAIRGSSIAHGVSVSGVDIGGQSLSVARKNIENASARASKKPLQFSLGKQKVLVSADDLELKYNTDRTLDRAQSIGRSNNPLSLSASFFTRYTAGTDISPSVSYNKKKFDAVALSLVDTFSKGRANAGVTIKGTTVSVVEPKNGEGISITQARNALHDAISRYSRASIRLHTEKSNASVSREEAERTASILRTMFSQDSVLATPAGNSITITPEQLAQSVTVTAQGERLVISVNDSLLRGLLGEQITAVEVQPVDATFAVNGSSVSVVPSTPGKQIDFAQATKNWIKGQHTFTASVREVQPAHDTTWAQSLNITEQVSSYTTNFPAGQERIKNIRRAAEVVNNTVIAPGESFSLNDTLGKRTAENGYVKAPVYSDADGFFEDYGGGASQFSTTLFNAVYVGGYKDIAHSPHSIYISRYPLGRDATLNYGSIDMKFKNDSNSGMLIRTSVGATSVTVVVYGNKEGRTVTLEGPKEISRTEPTIKYTDDPNMDAGKEKVTHQGYPGIVVENYRTVNRPGQPGKRETYRWTYNMVPTEVTRGTKAPAAPPTS